MTTGKILVTGAPGNVGTEVVRELQTKGVPFRVGAYDPETAAQVLGQDVDIVHFDFLNPATYSAAFDGVSSMFLVRPPALANVTEEIAPAIWAAVRAGVEHIVFLSLQGVEKNRVVPHHKIEQLILQTGVAYTFLRASFFMQNLSTTHRAEIRDRSEIALPVGNAKTSFIDARDIGAVAALALTESGHEGQRYTLTGAQALDYYQITTILTDELARPIQYKRVSPLGFIRRQLALGQRLGYVLVVTALYTITRFGNAKHVTDDVQALLGHAPISFEQFAHDYRAAWMPE